MPWLDEVKAISLIEAIIAETMPNCPDPKGWGMAFGDGCQRMGITDRDEIARLLANVGHESSDLTRLEENLSYSAERIVEVWPSRFSTVAQARPYARNPEGLANKVYAGRMGNTRPGDGFAFRGRGPIMLTGRANFETFRDDTGTPCVDNPDILLDREVGALCACWYWSTRVRPGSFETAVRSVNGGLIGYQDRLARYERAKALV